VCIVYVLVVCVCARARTCTGVRAGVRVCWLCVYGVCVCVTSSREPLTTGSFIYDLTSFFATWVGSFELRPVLHEIFSLLSQIKFDDRMRTNVCVCCERMMCIAMCGTWVCHVYCACPLRVLLVNFEACGTSR
jgi:hypothetical protein